LSAESAKRGEAATYQPPVNAGEVRILLVEDNPVNREVACGMLEVLNCQIDTAENGREAVDAIANADYALVLMDCQMPEMDGLTATKLIRTREAKRAGQAGDGSGAPRRRLPIVALTAHAMQGDREQCLSAGMDDHLTKPFTLVQLERMLARWLPNWSRGEVGRRTCPSGSVENEMAGDLPADRPPVSDSAGQPAGSVIDQTALAGIRALQRLGQPDIVVRVVSSYLETSPGLVDHIRSAVRSQNAMELRAAAHRLKSCSAQLGALAVSADCRELESMGERQDLTSVDEVLGRLERNFAVACAALQGEVTKGRVAA
jgi:CheY-like chemotaxis protein/HPt (histidine-containing phosphotransfer) domain-containing protein